MISLDHVHVRAGRFQLHDVSLTVERGSWAVLLGMAGAGKTTLLESIAGVRPLVSGRVALRGDDVTRLPPEARHVGMVYQHSFLFPHLTVQQNVAYGADEPAAEEAAALLDIRGLFERHVSALSGGERQLVALARALAARSDIMLLDEPFAALDPRRRLRVRTELRRLQQERGMTVLQVTHDFAEARSLASQAFVLDAGRLVQAASPAALFRAPHSRTIADFLGIDNVVPGRVTRGDDGTRSFQGNGLIIQLDGSPAEGAATAVVRGENVALTTAGTEGDNAQSATVEAITEEGIAARVSVRVGEDIVVAVVPREVPDALRLIQGSRVCVSIAAAHVHLC